MNSSVGINYVYIKHRTIRSIKGINQLMYTILDYMPYYIPFDYVMVGFSILSAVIYSRLARSMFLKGDNLGRY